MDIWAKYTYLDYRIFKNIIPNIKSTGKFPQSPTATAKQAVFPKLLSNFVYPIPISLLQFIDEFLIEILQNFNVINDLLFALQSI